MTDYDDLIQRMRDAASKTGGDGSMYRRTDLLYEGAVAIASLAERSVQPVRDMDGAILRREAADLAMRDSNTPGNPIGRADRWLAFLEDGSVTEARDRGEWQPLTSSSDRNPRETLEVIVGQALGAASVAWTGGTRGVFESEYVSGIVDALMAAIDRYADGEGAHVEIGGQRMTEAQYNAVRESIVGTPGEAEPSAGQILAARYPVQPPAHGLAVGDVIETRERLADAPAGTVVEDREGDKHYHHADGGWSWRKGGERHPLDHPHNVIRNYLPATVLSLPEPEDTTPRVGDTVRVESGEHRVCQGLTGALEAREGAPSPATAYQVRDAERGKHIGPLSDFELVKRADAEPATDDALPF